MGTVTKRTFVGGVASAALLSGGGAVLLTAPDGSADEPRRPVLDAVAMPAPPFVGGRRAPDLHVEVRRGRPLVLPLPPPRLLRARGEDPIADYLGLTSKELRRALHAGKSLEEIAKDQGKSLKGLNEALPMPPRLRMECETTRP